MIREECLVTGLSFEELANSDRTFLIYWNYSFYITFVVEVVTFHLDMVSDRHYFVIVHIMLYSYYYIRHVSFIAVTNIF